MQHSQGPAKGQLFHAVLAATAGTAILVGLTVPAAALPFLQPQQPQAAPARDAVPAPRLTRPNSTAVAARADKSAKESAAKDSGDLAARAKGVHTVVVSLDKQMLTLYADGKPVAHSRVSTGTASHPTPTGVFSIIQRDRWHRSNLYANAPMFYMQRITWSGVAMHQGVVPNYPASHGCIRLPESFARQMWGTTKMGARVIIARGDVVPAPITHAKLFTLKKVPDAAPVSAGLPATPVAFETTQLGVTATDAGGLTDPGLNAVTFALRNTRLAPTSSMDVVRTAANALDKGGRRAELQHLDGRPLKPGPVAVFISRKEGKLFVRKGFEPVFDVPVTIAQPEQPFGTHVYTALSFEDDNSTLRWNVVSLAPSASTFRKAEKGRKVAKVAEPVVAGPASSAAQSLERVTIPQEAIDRISEMMSPGSSLIISDHGISGETGKGTDFIVLTR